MPAAPLVGAVTTRAYVDVAQLVPVMYAIVVILIAYSLVVMYADIVKPITLPG